MKNILKVNGFFYILFFISILTGQFKMYINITLITLFHELGHIFMGLIFHYKIERIVIMPFGALTVFNKRINEYFIKDLIITIAGPLNQILLIPFLEDNKLNILLLFFNLLPIIPLDGSKILNLILNLIFPYRLSYKITFYISIASASSIEAISLSLSSLPATILSSVVSITPKITSDAISLAP